MFSRWVKLTSSVTSRIVSFDMNGTLTQDKFVELVWHEGVPRLYSRAKGISFDQAQEYVFQEYQKVGEERTEWYDIKYWFRFFDLGEDWMELLKNFEHEVEPFPDVIPVLEELGQYYQLVVTTNACQEFADVELRAAGLTGYFDRVLSSTSDFQEVKKTPEFYSKVCHTLQVKPEQIIHVGDHRLFDFTAPRKLGIEAYYLDRNGNEKGDFIVRDLSEFRDKLNSNY
jgi:putative hydrolase of the HAD superfamily